MFTALGAFSAAIPESSADLLAKAPPKLFWFACGRQDFLLERNRNFDKLLTERKINHVYRETEGPHTYSVWRQYLAEFAPNSFASELVVLHQAGGAIAPPASLFRLIVCNNLGFGPGIAI